MVQMPELLTPQEVAMILRVSYHKTLEFIKYSGVSYIKIGAQYRVEKNELFKFLSAKGRKYC